MTFKEDTGISFRVRPPGSSRHRLIVALAAIGGLAPHLAGLDHGFYHEDYGYLAHSWLAGSRPDWVLTQWMIGEFRPLGQAVQFAEFLVFGARPLPYNIVGLLLHGLVGILLFTLAGRAGIGYAARGAAAGLFLAGLGHYSGPVYWASCHTLLLGAVLALLSAMLIIRLQSAESRGPGTASFPYAAYLLCAAAMLLHEIFMLLPIGLVVLMACVRRGGLRAAAIVASAMVVLYAAATHGLHAELRESASYGLGIRSVEHLFQYGACLIAYVYSRGTVERAAAQLGTPAGFGVAAWYAILAVGAATLGAIALLARRERPVTRGLVALGLCFILPVLPMAMGPGWVQLRYLYPAGGLLALAFCSALMGDSPPTRRRRRLIAIALVLWYSSILVGTFREQGRARELSGDPVTAQERRHFEQVTGTAGRGD